eukprot:1174632-Amorphochlora_amoeboformis.AAC.3
MGRISFWRIFDNVRMKAFVLYLKGNLSLSLARKKSWIARRYSCGACTNSNKLLPLMPDADADETKERPREFLGFRNIRGASRCLSVPAIACHCLPLPANAIVFIRNECHCDGLSGRVFRFDFRSAGFA